MTPFALIVAALAAYRITRLLIDDEVIERPRNWVLDRFPLWLDNLFTCYWCIGFWVSVLVLAFAWNVPASSWVLAPFAISAVVGLIAERNGQNTE